MLTILSALTLLGGPMTTAGPLTFEALAFPTEPERARAIAVREDFAARFKGGQRVGPQELGNFISVRFCRKGANGPACSGGAIVSERSPGTGYGQVEVLHYDLPTVFGLIVSTSDVPEGTGIGVQFGYGVGGKSIVGTGTSVAFWALPDVAHEWLDLQLGSAVSIKIQDETVRFEAGGDPDAVLRELAASPESLGKLGHRLYEGLLAKVKAGLADDTILGFDEGKYEGRGIPPTRTPRPLTPSEKATELAATEGEIGLKLSFLDKNQAELHRRLLEVAPLKALLGK